MTGQTLNTSIYTIQDRDTIILKKAVWVYLLLLIFEGTLRRWFLPALATPLLIVRDPIVIWLVIAGMRKGWLKNVYAITLMIVATISFLLTLLVGHQNLQAALFGWRIYFFYFPFIFIIGNLLTRDDLLKMGKFILYLSIPMTVLIVMQFYSPQSAWINRGVGGDMEGAGFSAGALGYFRPPGIFSFIAGYTMFQLVVVCFLAYYLLMNKTLKQSQQIKPWLLWIMLACYLISIPYSISRTHFFQTMVVLFFLFMAGLWCKQFNHKIVTFALLTVLVASIILATGIANESVSAFTARFEGASKFEGGVVGGTIGTRYLGSFLRGFNDELPFWGYGIGLGTRAGSIASGTNTIYAFFNGEEEWSRVTGECGLLLGGIMIAVRCLFSLSIFNKAFRQLQEKQDLLPWILSAGTLLIVPQGQIGAVTNLGFFAFIGGIALAALNQKKES